MLRHGRSGLSALLAALVFFQSAIAFAPPVFAAGENYSAQDIKALMSGLNDPNIGETEKKRIAAIVFANQDVYRDAVIRGEKGISAKDADVDAFLRYKSQMQIDVIERMNINERNRTGKGLSGTVIPFPYNNILSDDDIVLGSGESGKKMEGLYNEALNEVVGERAGRPMTEADRARIDVNGLAWDMTQQGGLENFSHHEKYINPQSGFANQSKLAGGTLSVYTFDPSSGMLTKLPPAEAKAALERLATDKPLDIPGINSARGTGAMSDYARMADIHQLRFNAPLTPGNVATFIRNQKYTDRVFDDFDKIAKDANPALAAEIQDFIETSKNIRNQTNVVEVAKILEGEYKIRILDSTGAVDWKKLEEAIKIHQNRQLTVIIPKLIGAVAQNEAMKMLKWLEADVNGANRRRLRKQLAITYAPFGDGTLKSILADIDKIDASDADKAFLRSVLENDTRQIREYAKVLQIPVEELAARINLDGPSPKLVDHLEEARPDVARFSAHLAAKPGGGKFREFLKTKTAAALNLDVLIDGSPGAKTFQLSIILLATTRAYNGANGGEEGLKAMGMAVFEMIPFVASALRFSEMEFKESFKELAMDILPPIALAQIAVMALNYGAQKTIDGFTESAWDGLAREALKDFTKDDFEKAEVGHWRLKNRAQYLEYLEEIEGSLGRVQKLAALIEPEVDARMSRDETVKNNLAALHTLQYLEEIDIAGIRTRYSQGFSVDDIKKRVWEKGALAPGEAKNVERVAAKIILENLKIRAGHYTAALESFIDRIENLYNAENEDEDFDPSELVALAQAAIKGLYENAPDIIKNDAVGASELQSEYRRLVEILKNYDSQGAEEMIVRRQLQQIVDDFRSFIKRLLITVRLRAEMEHLDLRASVFGGDQSTVETEEVLLGDTFRIGASAKVSASRGGDAWTVFYYTPGAAGEWRLLGTASPRGSATGGGEGMFLIDAVTPGAMIAVPRDVIDEEFASEGGASILPVIAFGGWSDPLNQVGLAALQNPLAYIDLFDENRAAFAGAETQIVICRPKIKIKLPGLVHRDEEVYAEVWVDVPEYARRYEAAGQLKLSIEEPGQSPTLDPDNLSSLSMDPEDPTRSRIRSGEPTIEGTYWIETTARIKGFKEEQSAYPQKKSFDYTRKKKDEAEQAKEALTALRGLVGKMQKLDADSREILTRLQAAFDAWSQDEAVLRESGVKADAEIEKLRRRIGELRPLVDKVTAAVGGLRAASEAVNKAGVSATEARTNCENHVKGLCEAAQKLVSGSMTAAKKANLEGLVARKKASFENQRERFRSDLNEVTTASRAAEAGSENLSRIFEIEPRVSGALERLDALNGEADMLMSQMREKPREAADAVPAHTAIATEAGTIHAQASSLYAVAAILPDAAGPWSEIQSLHAAIQSRQPAIEKLAREFETRAAGLDPIAAEWENRKTGVRDEAAALLAQLPSPETAEELKKTVTDIKAGYDAVDLMTDSIKHLEQQAGQCADGDIEPMKTPAASPKPQEPAPVDSAFCGSVWTGRFTYDPVDRQGHSFPTEWFPPVDFTLWLDCGNNGTTGRIEETAMVEGRPVKVSAQVTNVRTEGSSMSFTKIYDINAGQIGQTSEYTGEISGADYTGQWTTDQYSAHFRAKRRE